MQPAWMDLWPIVSNASQVPCPRPDKRMYATRAEAKKVLRVWKERGTNHVYQCVCGWYHIGRLW